ncbi:Hypothetical_protein [Hexamita inflata]|uniref:Hypothetical_protein n=1 Tax=Hexamita inflata TaxID=28002 RepID=A0AA86TQI1_9EUKA|nr:Hypothetical protein HINF_LOCUS12255 [Hexamita inflata]
MVLNLLYIGNLCKFYQETRNLIKFLEYFWKRCLQLKWKTKSDTENILGQICSHLQTPWPFLKTARVSVFEQGWVVQFEVMQYQHFQLTRSFHFDLLLRSFRILFDQKFVK